MAKRKSTPDEPCLWERQEGETSVAYGAFLAFRDMGEKRSVSELVRRCGKSRSLLDRWRKQWQWDKRVLAYDNDLQKQAHAEAVKGLRDMNKRHIDAAMKLQQAALDALKGLDPYSMSAKDIKEMMKMAAELERLARQDDVSSFEEKEEEQQAEKETVHIYLPDNARG